MKARDLSAGVWKVFYFIDGNLFISVSVAPKFVQGT